MYGYTVSSDTRLVLSIIDKILICFLLHLWSIKPLNFQKIMEELSKLIFDLRHSPITYPQASLKDL